MPNVSTMVFKKLTVTIPEETMEKLERLAKRETRSKSNMVRHLIDKFEK